MFVAGSHHIFHFVLFCFVFFFFKKKKSLDFTILPVCLLLLFFFSLLFDSITPEGPGNGAGEGRRGVRVLLEGGNYENLIYYICAVPVFSFFSFFFFFFFSGRGGRMLPPPRYEVRMRRRGKHGDGDDDDDFFFFNRDFYDNNDNGGSVGAVMTKRDSSDMKIAVHKCRRSQMFGVCVHIYFVRTCDRVLSSSIFSFNFFSFNFFCFQFTRICEGQAHVYMYLVK
ncbi:hypothetical protein, unlikely [Trypanosoma brucei gambiense DAL972]|uniref:Uncharacterized protein n=1 Tax=Trypanosoma brucei gambiense (strain MHOM/CI/86/DAL972) TaxID=679716 RepID=D0A2R2_TRYB9|nr:hypothetical protein, unlikely [Trypanosoma brucei gambiense DAL972]CBH15556.1 hypothetical protein, unlikely [Trypanosoma brucei gambiense DAL972]|eukprot:XP_011777820.1 hypothetical protein, unlikely [Trypanosoma brucei gambiense DAL972]